LKNNKSFLYGILIAIFILVFLVLYGFHEKNRKIQLYKDFRTKITDFLPMVRL